MLLSIDNIKSMLQSQVTWLTGAEKEMILIITDSLMQRYYRELNSINQIIDYVSKQILNAHPLEPLLLVSPDSKPISKENALKELYQEVTSSKAFNQLKKKAPPMHGAASVVSRPSTGEGYRSRPASRPQSAITFNRPLSSTGLLIMKAANEAQGKAPSRTSSGRRLEAPTASSSSSSSSANYPSYMYNNSTAASTDANSNTAIPNDDSVIDDFSEAAIGNGKQSFTDPSIGSLKRASSINNIGSKRPSNAADITSRGTLSAGDKSKRKQSVVGHKEHTVSIEEMARRKAHAIYVSKRTAFIASLDTRRNEREKEFKRMGMTASVAKLAAFNDLHLQDDQDLEDFDMIHKPKTKKNFHKLTK